MKQVEQNYRSGALRVIDSPAPSAGPGSALVRSTVSLISAGTEKQIIDLARASLVGKAMARPDLVRRTLRKARTEGPLAVMRKVFAKLDTPIPLGYSLAGQVVEAGPKAGVVPSDRVACAGAGVANHAEYNAVPRNLLVRIPDRVDDEDASFVTLGAIALQGVRVANPTMGERVVVIGLGLIGLLTVQLLKANGCRVLGFDPNDARKALALDLGADAAVSHDLDAAARGFTAGHGADAVIVTASSKSSDPLNLAAEISRLKGRVVVVGMVGMTIDREPFYKRELDLRLSMSYGPGRHDPTYESEGHDYPLPYVRWTERRNMEAFLELVAAGKVTPKRLVTHRFPIEEAERAYALLESGEPYLAILLTYDEAREPARLVKIRPAPETRGSGIAFIGFGNYAKAVLHRALGKAGRERLVTVVTSTGISAHAAAHTYGFANASTDPAAAFEDPAISTVFIATRHESHASLAERALAAGKHVFVEKPLALTNEELDCVMAAARAGPGILTVGFNRRFAPMVVEARALLAGRQGPLNMVYRANAGAVPRESWLLGKEGGGRIAGEVCHFVDTLSSLAGAAPISVQSAMPRGVEDSIGALLTFGDGSVGTILYSSLGDPSLPKERLEIFVDGMAIVIDDFSRMSVATGGRIRHRTATQNKGQTELVAAFLAATEGAQPPIPLDELQGVSAATLALAGLGR